MLRQYELIEKVKSYDPDADEDALNKAFVYAMKMHGTQLRASGDPYFAHPVEVAGILTEFKLDCNSIIAGLLHDTIEDTDCTFEDIEEMFGEQVAKIVDGVTKLTKIKINSEKSSQAENFRKLVLAMSEDIRALLIKLADRLHNMRTLKFLKPAKRQRIARETMDIYAPLAERIGMQEVKTELEELSFKELHTEAYESIQTRLEFLREKGESFVPMIIAELEKDMKEAGLKDFVVKGREKSPFSIWKKMQKKNYTFEQLSDIMAFRIKVNNVGECYQALGAIHSKYHMIPRRFKDYISTPKPNGYKSLHTGIIGPQNNRVEIQIRTHEMHEVAEMGLAAHWIYKQGNFKGERGFKWLRELLEILEETANPEEFLENTKLDMYNDQVFCFTPKGDLINLPANSTPVDFAYAVHSAVGNKCVGSKINGEIRPLRTILNNGDQVEILTSKAQNPSPEWERFVVSGKAKASIRRYIRQNKKEQFMELGKQILQKTFKSEEKDFNEKDILSVLSKFKLDGVDEVYASIGEGMINAIDVFKAIYPEEKPKTTINRVVSSIRKSRSKRIARSGGGAPLQIKGLIPGMAVHFAGCCHPVPGDRIVGIVTTGKGVAVHTIDCETLKRFNDEPERWLDITWGDANDEHMHLGRLKVILNNEPGALGDLSNIIAKSQGNIANINITNRTITFFDIIIDVEVKDLKHLNNVILALKSSSAISAVTRVSK